jgi:hypothetical protein
MKKCELGWDGFMDTHTHSQAHAHSYTCIHTCIHTYTHTYIHRNMKVHTPYKQPSKITFLINIVDSWKTAEDHVFNKGETRKS